MTNRNTPTRQQGVVLCVALILLVVSTLLGLYATRDSTLQLLMAGNEQERMVAFETAQATIDAVLATKENYQVTGDPGQTNCNAAAPELVREVESGCDRYTVESNTAAFAEPPFSHYTDKIGVLITRMAPAFAPPPRGLETSADKFSVSSFSVRSHFDNTAGAGGRSEIMQGLMVLVPKNSQSN